MTEKAYFLHLGQLLRIRVVTLATRDGKSAPKHLVRRTAAAQKEDGKGQMSDILDGYLAYKDRWAAQSGYLIRNGR